MIGPGPGKVWPMPRDDTSRIVCRLSVGYPEIIQACEGLDGVTLVDARNVDTFARAIPDARVVVIHNGLYGAEIAATLKTRCQRLEWLHLVTAGWDALLKHRAPSGIPISNSSGIWTPVVVEHAFAMLLGLLRCLPQMERGRAQGRWVQGAIRDSLSCLRTRTLVVLGMGNIGRAAARIAKRHRPDRARPHAAGDRRGRGLPLRRRPRPLRRRALHRVRLPADTDHGLRLMAGRTGLSPGDREPRGRSARARGFHAPLQPALVPGISVPCGTGRDGLPVGLQIVAPRLHDRPLLAMAQGAESALQA
jgi:hypothetical protein